MTKPKEKSKVQAESLAAEKPSKSDCKDVVVVHGVTDDRQGLKVLRAREKGVELGEVRPVPEGKPIVGDVVRLRPRKNAPFICDVETEFSPSEFRSAVDSPSRDRVGPAQVATRSYRENWDAIFQSKVSAPGSSELN